ncbi:MAG: hypothetical protein IKB07_13190, partial [Lachnospiraceae bacterium]|nr:hypothetical protein [Lachnospiraceae bacterium]
GGKSLADLIKDKIGGGEKEVAIATTPAVAPGTSSGDWGTASDKKDKVIKVMSYSDELPSMVQRYLDMHPELGYTMDTTIVSATYGEYQPALDEMLMSGSNAPDIYAAEAAFVYEYTKGESSGFAATYDDLGIRTDKMMRESMTAPYAAEVGTRPMDNKVVGLPYESGAGCFIYRRSIAKATWGTDNPAEIQRIIGGGSGNWDRFWQAAEDLKARGYGIVSGDGDMWHALENSADQGWIVDGELYLDPKREALLDVSKKMKDNNYYNNSWEWQDSWFADMMGYGEKPILGFFGPAWLVNYTLQDNCGGTYGDWAVCNSPVGFWWGGAWVLASNNVVGTKKQDVVADIIQWITLDYDVNSFQYMYANGIFGSSVPDAVVSGAVMRVSDGRLEFLGGQNMFDYYITANEMATGRNISPYDEEINYCWKDAVREYVAGKVTRDEAIKMFSEAVASRTGLAIPDLFYEYDDDDRWYEDEGAWGPTPIPSRDLGGAHYIIGNWYSPEEPSAPRTAYEEATEKYRQEIFAKYNFTMQSKAVSDWGGMMDECVNSITNANPSWGVYPSADIYELDYRFVAKPMSNGLFYDLATLDEFDFSEEKWNKRVTTLMTKGDSIYGMKVGASIPRGGVIWNKRLMEEAGFDPNYIYDLQASGEWSWSMFEALCDRLTRDLDGDGMTDVYALASQDSVYLTTLVASTGSDFFVQEEDGYVYNNMNSQGVIDAYNFALSLYNAGYEMPMPEDADWTWFMDAFRERKAVMTFGEEYMLQPSADYGWMEDELGFVMPPKPDWATDYHSYVCDNIAIIPACFDEEEAGNIAFAYNVYTMTTPGWYEDWAWMEPYYDYMDYRAVEETLPYFQNEENAHFLLETIVDVTGGTDLSTDIHWCYPGFNGVTPAEQIASVGDKWDSICADANQW